MLPTAARDVAPERTGGPPPPRSHLHTYPNTRASITPRYPDRTRGQIPL